VGGAAFTTDKPPPQRSSVRRSAPPTHLINTDHDFTLEEERSFKFEQIKDETSFVPRVPSPRLVTCTTMKEVGRHSTQRSISPEYRLRRDDDLDVTSIARDLAEGSSRPAPAPVIVVSKIPRSPTSPRTLAPKSGTLTRRV